MFYRVKLRIKTDAKQFELCEDPKVSTEGDAGENVEEKDLSSEKELPMSDDKDMDKEIEESTMNVDVS